MKIIYPSVATAPLYGRSEDFNIWEYHADTIAPHAKTQRTIYTVPAGKLIVITGIFCFIRRNHAPAGDALAYIRVEIAQNGTSYIPLQAAITALASGTQNSISIGGNLFAKEGYIIRIYTYDAAGGGDCDYICNIGGVSIDK